MAEEPGRIEEDTATDLDTAGAWTGKHWRLVLIVAVALLLAISCREMQFNPDSMHYVDVARTMLSDHVVGTWHLTADSQRAPDTLLYWPPVYPALLALLIGVGLSAGAAAWMVSVAGYTASAWLLTRWQKSPAVAIAGALAFVHMSFLAGTPFRTWSESVFVPLMLGSLACMAAATASVSARRAGWVGLAAGALAGGAMLTRYAGLAIAPALAGITLMAPYNEDEQPGVRRNSLLAAAGGMVAVVAPWLVRNVVLNGRLFGPARPPNARPVLEILRWIGLPLYYDLAAVLMALLFAFVGYHLLRQKATAEGRCEWVFSGGLAWGALLCALSQVCLILITFLFFQIDEPPTKRYFFPAYACILLAGLAILSRAEIPEGVLRKRWGVIVPIAGLFAIGPIFAGAASTNVTPPSTPLDAWVEQNTQENDLIIADRAWSIRFLTGRRVLEAGQVAATPISEGEQVAGALERFSEHFDDIYVMPRPGEETDKVLASYPAAGLKLEEVATVTTRGYDFRRRGQYEQVIYRVRQRTAENGG